MKDRIKTLLIYSTGFRWQAFVAGTFLGLLGFRPDDPLPFEFQKSRLHHQLFPYKALSYVNDWLEAFCQCARLDIQLCDVTNLIRYAKDLKKIRDYELIIILHSATGDNMTLLSKTAPFFDGRKSQVVFFVGNEYDLLEEKIAFINSIEANYVCSQLPLKSAKWLYENECPKSTILEMPAALNPSRYFNKSRKRKIDIGFIGALYHPWLGDTERNKIIQYFVKPENTNGLKCDIRFKNVPGLQWAEFLNDCRGIVGAESGTYYLDAKGKTISKVKAHFQKDPGLSIEEMVKTYFLNNRHFVSGKCISSRHFEPIGTGTCQVLLEGHYNGILAKDKHYISVKKDLSNIEEALEKFKDAQYRNGITNTAHDYVINNHTYHHRIRFFVKSYWLNHRHVRHNRFH